MKKRVLLSIHPEFADAIFDGRKHFEFRRVIFKECVDEIVVYATAPISRVVGVFLVDDIYEGSPTELWEKTKRKLLGSASRDLTSISRTKSLPLR